MRGVAECQEALFEIEVTTCRLGAGWKDADRGTRSHDMHIKNRDMVASSAIPHNPRRCFGAYARQLAKRITKGNVTKLIQFHLGKRFEGVRQMSCALRGKSVSNGATVDDQGCAKKSLKFGGAWSPLRFYPEEVTYPPGGGETDLCRSPMPS